MSAKSHSQHDSQQSVLERFFVYLWFGKNPLLWLLRIPLLPLSLIFQLLAWLSSRQQKKSSVKLSVPVIVIGNITVGGTGKTPIVIALVNALKSKGVKVGVISRGYRSGAPHYPYVVNIEDSAEVAGDEPLLIARNTQAPVVIGKKRVVAAQYLLQQYPDLEMIISDDGLQHYRLQRDAEVIVVDGERGLGNHLLIPAGPLREPAHRLASADWILLNQPQQATDANKLSTIELEPQGWLHIQMQKVYPLEPLPWKNTQPMTAVTGIGNPDRFFRSLKTLGIDSTCRAYDDHYSFSKEDFSDDQESVVLMTEKDAVKCQAFAQKSWWALQVNITLPADLLDYILNLRNS